MKTKKVKAHLVRQKVYILFLQYKYYPDGFEQYGGVFDTMEKAEEQGKKCMATLRDLEDYRVSVQFMNRLY